MERVVLLPDRVESYSLQLRAVPSSMLRLSEASQLASCRATDCPTLTSCSF